MDTVREIGKSYNTVTRHLKAGIVEPEQMSIARQSLGKHIPAAKEYASNNRRTAVYMERLGRYASTTIEELLGQPQKRLRGFWSYSRLPALYGLYTQFNKYSIFCSDYSLFMVRTHPQLAN
jgi:hypothetical protein